MKAWFQIIKQYLRISFLNTLLIIFFICFLGPYLAINGKVLFASTEAKIMGSALTFLTWIIYAGVQFFIHQEEIKSTIKINDPDYDDNIINNELKAIWQFAKQHLTITNHRVPVYLLLGDKGTGKTEFLRHAKATNILHEINDSNITRALEWWHFNNLLIISPKSELSAQQWQRRVDGLYRWQNRLPIVGIVTLLDAPSLSQIDPTLRVKHKQCLEQFLRPLQKSSQKIPCYFLISKCDLIQGFTEFFADLGRDERLSRFGIDLSTQQKLKEHSKYLTQQIQSFIKQLGDRLIWRLHQEVHLARRELLQNFPIQITALTDHLHELITKLPFRLESQIHGIYFTTSVQKGTPMNYLMENVSQTLNFTPLAINDEIPRLKPYFLNELLPFFSKVGEFHLPNKKKRTPLELSAYPIAAISLSIIMIWLNQNYQENNNLIAQVNQQLIHFSNNNDNQSSPMTRLNALNIALNSLQNQEPKLNQLLVLNQAKTLTIETGRAYRAALQSVLLPILDDELVKTIQTNLNDSPIDTYEAIQTYYWLTQNDIQHRQNIIDWFTNTWNKEHPNDLVESKQIAYHLENLLALEHFSWPTHPALIINAQKKLASLDDADFTFLLLQHQTVDNNVPILLENKNPLFSPTINKIPAIYSHAFFPEAYNKLIPQLVTSIASNRNTTEPAQLLIQKVQHLYLKNYNDFWQKIYSTLNFQPTNDLNKLDQEVKIVQDAQSTFWQWLQLIADNTLPINDNTEFNETIATHFAELQTLVIDHKALTALGPDFDRLHDYIHHLTTARDIQKNCYGASVDRFEADVPHDPLSNLYNALDSLPKPLQTWTKNLLDQIWSTVLLNARTYINQVWSNNVVPEYDKTINHRFPIFSEANLEISRKDFTHFFGTNGTLDTFFDYYLKPYVDTSHLYWHWKTLNDATIGIDQPTLEMFIRAALIKRMFYNDSGQLAVQFRLTPVTLAKNSDAFQLQIDNQTLVFDKANKEPLDLVWPADDHSAVKMQFFSTTENDNPIFVDAGDWSLFRLLQKSTLEKTDNTSQYFVTFSLGDQTAKYQLDANNMVNPFIPDILNNFRCPDSLTAGVT